MIGKPEWFARRKYGGWGLTIAKWQGGVYIAAFILPFAIFQALPYWSIQTRIIVTGIWLAVLLIDVLDIMRKMKKDERERTHEAFAERNAAWVMVTVITAGLLYQLFTSALQESLVVDWFLVAALFGGLIAKATTNLYLERKE